MHKNFSYTVKSEKEAWEKVNELFPSDYEKDEESSRNAGYPVYRSTSNSLPHAWHNYICDLCTRLEINLVDENWNGTTININIVEDVAETATETEKENIMHEYAVTIGLFDKDTEKQEISVDATKRMISDCLLNKFEIFAFTMFDCMGCYKMNSTGRIVHEPSIRIEIVSDKEIKINEICAYLKSAACLNQESIMVKHTTANIDFV